MENSQIIDNTKTSNQIENYHETQNQIMQQQDNSKQIDALPNQTLYINNLNEKIKTDGKKFYLFFNKTILFIKILQKYFQNNSYHYQIYLKF